MKPIAIKGMSATVTTLEEVVRPLRDGQRRISDRLEPVVAPPETQTRDPNALEPSIYRFILRHSLRQQLWLLALTLVSFPFLYYSLELPKTIVNRAIGGKHFPQFFLGMEFSQIPYLMTLCGVFLALV